MGSKKQAKTAKIIFGVLCLFAGLASALGGNQIEKIKNAYASLDWPTTEGMIVASGIEWKSDRRRARKNRRASSSYFASIKYNYTIETRKYTSTRISFGDYGSSDRDRVEEITGRYPEGKSVQVYYNPREPQVSVLETGAPLSTYVPLGVGISLFLLGGGFLYSGIFKE